MKICNGCGRINGKHGSVCVGPSAEVDIHESHLMANVESIHFCCANCNQSLPSKLVLPCKGLQLMNRKFKIDLVSEDVYLKDGQVWALYLWDHSPMIISIHVSSEDAVRENTNNYSIMPWKIGTDFQEAVREWEARNSGRQ